MTNHPNRGAKGPQSNPAPAEIIAARQVAGLTQTEAAELIHASLGAWQKWEDGSRRMHPAMWDLFCILVRAGGAEQAFSAWWREPSRFDNPVNFEARSAWSSACDWVMGKDDN